MTSGQKAWLDSNPDYRMIGVLGGNMRFTDRGALKADGTLAKVTKGVTLDAIVAANPGSFGVGRTFVHEPGQPGRQAGGTALQGGVPSAPVKRNDG